LQHNRDLFTAGNFLKMKTTTENLVKITLAVLLLACLLQLPFGYYRLVRFVAVVGFAILVYYEYERKNIPLVIIYLGLAVLFQPLEGIPLGRPVWMVVDVIVAVCLVISIFVRERF
jgi:hypothetical protein